jgi:hypothetical protein
MPDRLTATVAATTMALAAAAFGGAYALTHGEPAAAPAEARPPVAITLAEDPLGKLSRARPLPGLAAPPAPPEPVVDEEPDADRVEPVAPITPTPVPAPIPAPIPTPAPEPEPAPPSNFDDSG